MIIQFLIVPRYAENKYYRKYEFEKDFLCELMNTKPENRFSKLTYQISALLFGISNIILSFFVKTWNIKYAYEMLLLFSIFFCLQVIIHGQDNRFKLLFHGISLISAIVFHFALIIFIYQKLNPIFTLVYFIMAGANIIMIIFNLIFEKGRKTMKTIVLGKLGYILLISTQIYLVILFYN